MTDDNTTDTMDGEMTTEPRDGDEMTESMNDETTNESMDGDEEMDGDEMTESMDDSDETADGTDENTGAAGPGFTVAIASVALLGAALLVVRRRA